MKDKDKKDLINSLIPIGMLLGVAFSIVISIFLGFDKLVYLIPLGAATGFIFGTIAFIYFEKSNKK